MIGVTEMIDLQRAATADHIAALTREGAALRAERTRDQGRELGATRHPTISRVADAPSRRVRIGRWLISVGEAIAGPARPLATSHAQPGLPADDAADALQRAA
jgi:hypothetical protein